jgi:hypothetical protein
MLTPDQLAALPIFSALSPVALADVARAAADIHLNPGEYAVYEGEPPALFVVLKAQSKSSSSSTASSARLERACLASCSARFLSCSARSFRRASEPVSRRGS